MHTMMRDRRARRPRSIEVPCSVIRFGGRAGLDTSYSGPASVPCPRLPPAYAEWAVDASRCLRHGPSFRAAAHQNVPGCRIPRPAGVAPRSRGLRRCDPATALGLRAASAHKRPCTHTQRPRRHSPASLPAAPPRPAAAPDRACRPSSAPGHATGRSPRRGSSRRGRVSTRRSGEGKRRSALRGEKNPPKRANSGPREVRRAA